MRAGAAADIPAGAPSRPRLTAWPKSQHTAARKTDRKIGIRGRSMAFAFGGAGALLKAFVPTFQGLRLRGGFAAKPGGSSAAAPAALSPEAEAALAALDLRPDGPIDPDEAPRARLAPDVAARNFVRWAQALDLDGDYATRSIYALYCEFSEVDGRPPLRDTRFLDALAKTQGIATLARGKDKARRAWRWTIAPARSAGVDGPDVDVWTHEPAPAPRGSGATDTPAPSLPHCALPHCALPHCASHDGLAPAEPPAPASAAEAAVAADVPAVAPPAAASPAAPAATKPARARPADQAAPAASPVSAEAAPASALDPAATIPAPAVSSAPAATSPPAASIAPASVPTPPPAGANAPVKAARSSVIVLPRFVVDAEHPFSPAGLRERQKSARRMRLNAAASRKQRGRLRRAA
jgi:hypothetical protein